jgi:hypothetical protein
MSHTSEPVPLVSVLIRSTGRPELSDALDSVCAQTHPRIEVVLIDVRGRGELDPEMPCPGRSLRVVSRGRHLGRGAAANLGLDSAQGDYLVFLDDDDWFFPEHVSLLVDAVLGNPDASAAYAGIGCRRQSPSGDWQTLQVFNEAYDPTRLLLENYLPMHAVLFDRALLRYGLRFEESFRVYEDWDFWIQLSQLTPLVHVDRITAVYRIAADSGFGIRGDDPEVGPGYARLLEKWRSRWTTDQLVELAGLPAKRVSLATADLQRQLAEQQSRTAELEAQLAASEVKAATLPIFVARLKALNESAAWQVTAGLYRLENSRPSVVRPLLTAVKLVWWALTLQLRCRLHQREFVARTLESGLFDEPWYIEQYPEVLVSGYRPIVHWLVQGARDGTQPNPLFLTYWYCERHPAATMQPGGPLLHYVEHAKTVGCDPNPLFDSAWYLERNPEVAACAVNPLAHYLQRGWRERRDPHPLFNVGWYLQELPELAAAGLEPLAHFLREGVEQGCDPNPLFDSRWYLAEHPELSDSGLSAFDYYRQTGVVLGHDPSVLFDTRWYQSRYPEVRASGLIPLAHYLSAGARLRLDANPVFDAAWYAERYPDSETSGLSSLGHFFRRGRTERLGPSPLFDTDWYIAEYLDQSASSVDALAHYLHEGAAAGCDPNPFFHSAVYLSDPTTTSSPIEALREFADSGAAHAPGAYRGETELLACQAAFHAQTHTSLLHDHRQAPRRFAIFLQCGAGRVDNDWGFDSPRTWDLLVNHYDPAFVERMPCEIEFQQTGALPGTKFTALNSILTDWPDLVLGYDHVLLLDDDIRIEAADLSRLFELADRQALDLVQASLSAESGISYDVFRTRGGSGLRYLNGVEIMMPVISRRAMLAGRELFAESVSGWGIDMALASRVRNDLGGKAAVVDEIVAEHLRGVDQTAGAYYQMLHSANIYEWIEFRHLKQKYGTDSTFYEVA